MRRVGGTVTLTVGGNRVPMMGNWTWSLGGFANEAAVSSVDVVGFTSTRSAPFLDGESVMADDVDVAELGELEGETAILELPDGSMVVFRDCFRAGDPPVVNTESGNFSLRLEAGAAELVPAAA